MDQPFMPIIQSGRSSGCDIFECDKLHGFAYTNMLRSECSPLSVLSKTLCVVQSDWALSCQALLHGLSDSGASCLLLSVFVNHSCVRNRSLSRI
jgi:hypothetical protein